MSKLERFLDVLIIGAGAAGLSAGIYAARCKLKTLILEDEIIGGQINDAYVVENYPGFAKIKGSDLTARMQEQAQQVGAEIDEFDKIVAVKLTNEDKVVETKTVIYRPATVIIASGMKRRELPIPEEKKFRGKGIHYCELCDGHLYNDKTIAVVGGGNAAVDATGFLGKYARKIYLIHRSQTLRADAVSQEKLFRDNKVTFLPNSRIVGAKGEGTLHSVVVEDVNTGKTSDLEIDGVFVYIGSDPKTELYTEYIELDKTGNIMADETCETNVQGVFAAGDVRAKAVRQLTTAVSDGTVAALGAEKYIQRQLNKYV